MSKGGFMFRKWKANEESVLNITKEEVDQVEEEIFVNQSIYKACYQGKILRIKWNEENGIISIGLSGIIQEKKAAMTKRALLSSLSIIYDPLKLVGPVTIVARKHFQGLCKVGVNQDSIVDQDVEEKQELFV